MEMWFSEFHTDNVKYSLKIKKHLYSSVSEYHDIDVLESEEFGKVLVLDGNIMLTEKDEFIYDEMICHVPMSVHPCAENILVIGGGDGGVVKELTVYDKVRKIDLVEMDPEIIKVCGKFLPENIKMLNDARVNIYIANALKFIRKQTAVYDLIIVDCYDPLGASESYFTREFYGSCFNALKEDGIMVNQLGSPFFSHNEDEIRRSHRRMCDTFPVNRVYQAHIPTYAGGYWLFGFASRKYHPIKDFSKENWLKNNFETRYYTERLHTGAFYLPAFLEKMLKEVE